MQKVKVRKRAYQRQVKILLLLILLAAGAALMVLAQRSALRGQTADDIEDKLRISVIMPHNNDGYWSKVIEGCQAAAAEYHSKVDVKTYFPQFNYNIGQMTALIEQQIAARVDAVIVQGNENPDYKKALEKAGREGIQVILIDTDIRDDSLPHLYIGTDNVKAGDELGRRLIELTGGQAAVAVLSGEKGYSNLEERYRGVREAVAQYPGIRLLSISYDHYDTMTVLNQIRQLRAETPMADTLVCLEGTAGRVLGERFSLGDKPFKHIIAVDDTDGTLKGVRSGVIDAVMVQQPCEMGRLAVEQAAEQPGRCKALYTGIQWVTPDMAAGEAGYEKP